MRKSSPNAWLVAAAVILFAIGLLALAFRGEHDGLKLLGFIAIVGMAAWGWGKETKAVSREPKQEPVPDDVVAVQKNTPVSD